MSDFPGKRVLFFLHLSYLIFPPQKNAYVVPSKLALIFLLKTFILSPPGYLKFRPHPPTPFCITKSRLSLSPSTSGCILHIYLGVSLRQCPLCPPSHTSSSLREKA